MAGTNTWLVDWRQGLQINNIMYCMMHDGATGRYIAHYSAATKVPSDLGNIIPVVKPTNTRSGKETAVRMSACPSDPHDHVRRPLGNCVNARLSVRSYRHRQDACVHNP